jgi:hypothetical protein
MIRCKVGEPIEGENAEEFGGHPRAECFVKGNIFLGRETGWYEGGEGEFPISVILIE